MIPERRRLTRPQSPEGPDVYVVQANEGQGDTSQRIMLHGLQVWGSCAVNLPWSGTTSKQSCGKYAQFHLSAFSAKSKPSWLVCGSCCKRACLSNELPRSLWQCWFHSQCAESLLTFSFSPFCGSLSINVRSWSKRERKKNVWKKTLSDLVTFFYLWLWFFCWYLRFYAIKQHQV